MNTRLRADLALVFIAFVWGATFVVIKRALDDVSSIFFLTIRFSLAAVLLAIYFRRGWMPERRHLAGGTIVGACLGVGYALQTIGLETTTPANAGFITGFYIPLVPILAALLHRRAPSRMEVAGVSLATIGIILLTLPEGSLQVRSGDLFVLAGAVSFAGHILSTGHFARSIPHRILSFTQIAVSALFGWGSFWWAETVRVQWTPAVLFALLATAVFATAVAFAVQSWAQQHTTATRTALIFSLEPVFAWLTSYLVSGEVLSYRGMLGAAAVLAGILIVELRGSSSAPGPEET
jgi:drug/metabolite transporter (DMT)-like permease